MTGESSTNTYTEAEHELTHLLVTELLAAMASYLLTYLDCVPLIPHRIDTQDVLLGDYAAERLIEIGPADTLANMARKTQRAAFAQRDAALGLERQILSYKKQSDVIYYHAEQIEESAAAPTTPPFPSAAENRPTPEPAAAAPAPQAATPAAVVNIPDQPITPSDILTTLLAYTLKAPRDHLSPDKTLKQLCGGRSTVQNEIIGDLSKEFGSLPDQAEDLPLTELSASLSSTKLGPCATSLVAKVVSAKMPAGSSVAFVRAHLAARWSLGPGLQDRVLLAAIGRAPASRLADESQARAWLDGLVRGVLAEAGVDINAVSAAAAAAPTASAAVDPEALKQVRKEQEAHDRRLAELFAKRSGVDVSGGSDALRGLNETVDELQKQLDAWTVEHGDAYAKGILPKFDVLKARKYDSYWNWAIQDLLRLVSRIARTESPIAEDELAAEMALLEARATPRMLQVIQFLVEKLRKTQIRGAEDALETLMRVYKRCAACVDKAPVVRASAVSMAPVASVNEDGHIEYSEVPRHVAEARQRERFRGGSIPCGDETYGSSTSRSISPRSRSEDTRSDAASTAPTSPFLSASDPMLESGVALEASMTPNIRTKGPVGWRQNRVLTGTYLQWISTASTDGATFQDKAILITGAGKNSIGVEMVKMVLTAGASVIVTTSSYSPEVAAFYQDIYAKHGGRGSRLVVVPFNGGSQQDVVSLVEYIYDSAVGLGWDLDHVVPFAAVGEAGRAIDGIDSTSELAHRVMLTNLVRLLGAIKTQKERRRIHTHPTQVILPLSPNHGIFGHDGLYAESKIGLESLLNKWWSEDWNPYLSLCGTVIGWTRGTGLMASNDFLAAGVEEMQIRTFSKTEMALHIAGLMASPVASYCELEPLLADISGGLSAHSSLRALLDQIQSSFNTRSEVRRALKKESALEEEAVSGAALSKTVNRKLNRRARIKLNDYKLPDYASEIAPLSAQLQGMVDLDRVPVIVGFGETGPYGNSRTRWEMETTGTFSIDGCLEMAWIMGLIKYHNGPLKGQEYCGWLEASSGTPINDAEVKAKFESYILEHTGIRITEPREHDPADPTHKQFLHEVALTDDLEPFEVSAEAAQDFKREHGNKAEVTESDGQIYVKLKAGATLMIPKASKLKHAVGAQVPTGWDARTYGIPEDIISQVDPATLYTIVATVEAFLSAGITDPYELYEHAHVSEVAVCVGSGLGGVTSLHRMFKQRFMDRQVQKDVLAETFINTTSAWVNMLLLGGAGPIRTPVGACATALESVDTGFDLVANGRAKACLVGGFDGLEQDVAAEFANMRATVDVDKETAAGRVPREMSRPTASSRGGFVEGEGCGIQLMTTAALALRMGLPIRGVVALTHTASDKIGRSVPAPGKGLLTIASEAASKLPSPMLSMAYRRRNMEMRRAQIEEKKEDDLLWLKERLASPQSHNLDAQDLSEYAEECRKEIEADAARSLKEILNTYGNELWKGDARVSPLRGALAVWGLTVDDVDVASMHGTSTVKNDLNESDVIQQQLSHLNRTKGNVLPCVCQKSLTGHAKGAAGAFALNGCFQMMATGTIPGNRNADNIDEGLADFDLLVFSNQTIQDQEIKAFSVTSFGFGQKGAQVIGVNPKYLFATISEQEYCTYRGKVETRLRKANRYFQDGFYGNKLVVLKDESPYKSADTERYLMDAEARI